MAGQSFHVIHATPLSRLDQARAEQAALDTSIALFFATLTFKEGLRHMLRDDLFSAMRSFYVACEAVVLASRHDTQEKDSLAAPLRD